MKRLHVSTGQIGEGSLILVNAAHPVRREPGQLVVVGGVRLERRAAQLLSLVLADYSDVVVPVSGYRPLREQEQIYADSLRAHGPEFTAQYVALPGCSEHQTGLAVDLGRRQASIDFLRPELPYTGVFADLRSRLLEAGFVERYPAGREEITGIAHEPWHFRYVGRPHALLMQELGLVLEEYTAYLRQFSPGAPLRVADYLIYYVAGSGEVSVPDGVPYALSGNNVDGMIVTLWVGAA